jgi:hypothetical protein
VNPVAQASSLCPRGGTAPPAGSAPDPQVPPRLLFACRRGAGGPPGKAIAARFSNQGARVAGRQAGVRRHARIRAPEAVTQGRQIEAGRQYTLAINDFTAASQKTELKATGLVFTDTGKLLRGVIIQYIRKRGTIP